MRTAWKEEVLPQQAEHLRSLLHAQNPSHHGKTHETITMKTLTEKKTIVRCYIPYDDVCHGFLRYEALQMYSNIN